MPRRAHADFWRDMWFKLEDLGLVGSMRKVLNLEGFVFDPSVANFFVKVRLHLKEEEVPSAKLLFWGVSKVWSFTFARGFCL